MAEATGTWFLSGRARHLYTLRPDPAAPIAGEPGHALSPVGLADGSYVTAMAVFPGAPYIGRRVRLSTSVRTEGVTGRGDFWVRAQGPESPPDGPGFGGGAERLEPTAAFTPYEVVFRVPPGTDRIEVGAGIGGPGRLWVGAASLEVVGEPEIPDTPIGTWQVTWDRSATGWRPPMFHGTLVLGPGEAHLDWDETSGDLEVRSLDVSGAAFRVELGSVGDPTFSILLEGVADGEGLAGSASAQDARGAVPRSPLRGRRASPATTGR